MARLQRTSVLRGFFRLRTHHWIQGVMVSTFSGSDEEAVNLNMIFFNLKMSQERSVKKYHVISFSVDPGGKWPPRCQLWEWSGLCIWGQASFPLPLDPSRIDVSQEELGPGKDLSMKGQLYQLVQQEAAEDFWLCRNEGTSKMWLTLCFCVFFFLFSLLFSKVPSSFLFPFFSLWENRLLWTY